MSSVGVDLVYLPEFKKQLALGGDKLILRTYNQEELADQSLSHLAGIWAAKEAVIKAAGFKIVSLRDIMITYNKSGRPSAEVSGRRFSISIAHQGQYAVSVAVRSQ